MTPIEKQVQTNEGRGMFAGCYLTGPKTNRIDEW